MMQQIRISKQGYVDLYEHFCRSLHCDCINPAATDYDDCGTKVACCLHNIKQFLSFCRAFRALHVDYTMVTECPHCGRRVFVPFKRNGKKGDSVVVRFHCIFCMHKLEVVVK